MKARTFGIAPRVAAAAACLALITPLAHADVYRWVGANGTVNYGSKPPPNAAQLERLERGAPNISVIPAPPRLKSAQTERTPPANGPRAAPAAAAGPSGAGPAIYRNWIERCVAERRVDCSDPTAATFDTVRSFSESTPYRPGSRQ